ncbi:hypothetical protein PRIPAC_78435 [Pristionchus pacificus]|uniref:Uncharacterized protein n=1 Tax=Pristionchus pacificus TaxID=54126 RepID=A0A2A6CBT6_PRIPA|nr:hypothetical protein PRIPAC_78435 [Pristionchus pacificus]|eukprot:PDM75513.1 hypothetical protein PRIPAC_42690 [Pristionchus pacificus]
MSSESDQNKRENEKLKKEADLLHQELKQIKKECEEKGCPKCDAVKSERKMSGPSPSLFNE